MEVPNYVDPTDIPRTGLKIAIGQILKDFRLHRKGDDQFKAVQESAFEALTDVAERYLVSLGTKMALLRDHAGRTEGNFLDLTTVFEQEGISLETIQRWSEKFQFPFPRDTFPLLRAPVLSDPELHDRPEPRPPHIPPHLPTYPDKHTFIQTPAFVERIVDPKNRLEQQIKVRLQTQEDLAKLSAGFPFSDKKQLVRPLCSHMKRDSH